MVVPKDKGGLRSKLAFSDMPANPPQITFFFHLPLLMYR
jgi:hypothetical protein